MIRSDYKWLDVSAEPLRSVVANNTPWTKRADGGTTISLQDIAEMNEVGMWLRAAMGRAGQTGAPAGFSLSSAESVTKPDAARVVSGVAIAIEQEYYWLHRGVSWFEDHSRLDSDLASPLVNVATVELNAARALMGRQEPFSAMTAIGDEIALSIKTEFAANAKRIALTAGPAFKSNGFIEPFEAGTGHDVGQGGHYGNVAMVNPGWVSGSWLSAVVQPAGRQHGDAGTTNDPGWANYFGSATAQTSGFSAANFAVQLKRHSATTPAPIYAAGRYPYGVALGIVYRMEHGWAGDNAPSYGIETKYVFWGKRATASGSGRDQIWSTTGPTMAELVAATGWSLRAPVQTPSVSGYGDVISAYIDGIGMMADWQLHDSRWIGDFY